MALVAPDGLNHWISNGQYAFARWWWFFDSSRIPARDQLLHVARIYEAAAEGMGILRPMIKTESGEFVPLKEATGLSFCAHLEQRLVQQDETGNYEPLPPIKYPTRIAFYDENADIVEREIDNVGSLLLKLRPDKSKYNGHRYMEWNAPVDSGFTLQHLLQWSQYARFQHHTSLPLGHRPLIGITLCTDIWFGKVVGWIDDPYEDNRWFDNLDLAERHTPRLNQFIQAINAVFQEIEGSWEREEEETLIRYRPLISETGITLD